SGSSVKVWIIVLGVLAIGAVALVVMVPQLVKRRCIETAAAEGITLTIGSARVAWGAVHLSDVSFKIDDVPQLAGEATDVDVTLAFLTPTAVAAQNVGITIDGSAEDLEAAVDKWRANRAKARDETAPAVATEQAMKVTMLSGHVAWTRAFGMIGKID